MFRSAQVFSIDFVVSFLIAIILASMLLPSLSSSRSSLERSRDLSLASSQSLAQLVQSPGAPLNWTFSSATSIGLAAERPGVLDAGRLAYFLNQSPSDYDSSLSLLGFYRDGAVYDYNLEIISPDGQRLYSLGNASPSSQPVSLASSIAVLNNSPVAVHLYVWVRP